MQVGYSKSLQELRCDARWWLVNSSGQTRVVLVIHISLKPAQKFLRIETWRMTAHSALTVNDQGVVNPQGGQLKFEYGEIFDNPPPAGVGDIILPTADVQRVAIHIFNSIYLSVVGNVTG